MNSLRISTEVSRIGYVGCTDFAPLFGLNGEAASLKTRLRLLINTLALSPAEFSIANPWSTASPSALKDAHEQCVFLLGALESQDDEEVPTFLLSFVKRTIQKTQRLIGYFWLDDFVIDVNSN